MLYGNFFNRITPNPPMGTCLAPLKGLGVMLRKFLTKQHKIKVM